MSLGENLQRLRKEKGLSQEDVAQKLFVSRQSVSKWENGAAEPGVENLKALANLYGVTLDELMGNVPAEDRLSTDFEPDPAYMDGQRQAEERQQGETAYRKLLFFRVFMWGLVTVGVFVASSSITVSLDLIALVVGIWVIAPAMWVVILCLEALNIAFTFIMLIETGNVFSAVTLIVCIICLFVMTRPSVKARFHRT